jgi:hypothetical protein
MGWQAIYLRGIHYFHRQSTPRGVFSCQGAANTLAGNQFFITTIINRDSIFGLNKLFTGKAKSCQWKLYISITFHQNGCYGMASAIPFTL